MTEVKNSVVTLRPHSKTLKKGVVDVPKQRYEIFFRSISYVSR